MKKLSAPARLPEKARVQNPNGNGNGLDPEIASSVTKGRQSKRDFEQAIQRYVDLFDFAPVAYLSFDRVGRIEEVNFVATELFGRPRNLLIGRPISLVVHHDDIELLLDHVRRCRSSESHVQTELRMKNAGGQTIFAHISSTPTTSTLHNGARLYQTAIVDLTDRLRSEAALRISKERFRTLFDMVPVAVYACDPYGVIREFNQRAAELWGREPNRDNAPEKYCGSHKIYYPDGRPMPHEECPMARALRGEKLKPSDLEIIIERPDGERRHVIPSPSILRDDRGRIMGAINCLYDITERKKSETALTKLAEQQQALYQFVQRRQDAESLREVCQAGIDAIVSAVHCDRAAVLMSDPEEKMRFVAWHGLSDRYRNAVEVHSPWKPNTRNPRPIYISDVSHSDLSPALARAVRREGISALTFIPMVRENRVVGKVVIYHNAPHTLTKSERNLCLTIAGQLALGIERKRSLDALRESEELHRTIVRQTVVGLSRSNLHGVFMFANRNFCEMLGYAESELLGKSITEITHPDDLPESKRLFRELVRSGRPYRLDKRYIRKNGSVLWVSVSASPMKDAAGRTKAVVAVVLDINQNKQAEFALAEAKSSLESRVMERTAELLSANEQLQNEIALRKRLEGEILEVSDREQRRLGQDLHDSLCQHLTATALMAHTIAVRLRDHRVVESDDIDKVAELINAGVAEARMIARGLHPVEMDEAGLVVALQSLLHRQSKLPYRLDLDEDLTIPDPTVALHLYRIAREAVINANKHAGPCELQVRMRRSGKQIELSVTDNGVGIDEERDKETGMGFHIMKYRARSIGARLEVTPVKPHGTRVVCYLPAK